MIKHTEQEPIPLKKDKRIIKYRRDKEGHKVLPYHLFFEDIDYDNTEFVEEENEEPYNWTDHLGDVDPEVHEPSEEEKKAILQTILNKRDISDETYYLCTLPAGTVIVLDSEYRKKQPPDKNGVHSKTRPLAISPRGKLQGKVALLQITTSPPRGDYDIQYNNISKNCGLKYPSTVRCADVLPLSPDFPVYEDEIKGTLTKDSNTWKIIVETCKNIPDSDIEIYGQHRLNCSLGTSGGDVIAYVVMPNY